MKKILFLVLVASLPLLMAESAPDDDIVTLPVGYRFERHREVFEARGRIYSAQLVYFFDKTNSGKISIAGASLVLLRTRTSQADERLDVSVEATSLTVPNGPTITCHGSMAIICEPNYIITVIPCSEVVSLGGRPITEAIHKFLTGLIETN